MEKLRGQIEWVSIDKVVPNPLNPRKNDGVKTEEMQDILKKRGWEEPLTVYKKGQIFVVLAGHRRLFAAKQIGVKELPVFVTEQPQDHGDELERIASLQSGRVEWTSWEWARFVYERWLAWNKPPVERFAKDINLRYNSVKSYIHVLEYYPRHLIETGLSNGSFTISGLNDLRAWLIRFSKSQRELYEQLGLDLLRTYMLEKLETRRAANQAMKNVGFLDHVPTESLREFLTTKEATLEGLIEQFGDTNGTAYKSFHGQMISLGLMSKRVKEMKPKTTHQKEQALVQLQQLRDSIQNQIKNLERFY